MTTSDLPVKLSWIRSIKQAGLVAIIPLFFMIYLHFPMLSSDFSTLTGDHGDTLLNLFFLEHGYQWLTGKVSFWDAPMLYPDTNTMAYSDLMFGFGLPYWITRLLGAPINVAFGLWMISMVALNFVTFYFFLIKARGASILAATLGATLFTFALSRYAQVTHIQLMPQFYLVLSVWAIHVLYDPDRSPLRRRLWIAIATLALLAQAYAAFYMLYFILLAFVGLLLVLLIFKIGRQRLWMILKRDGLWLLGAFIISCVVMIPWLQHYLTAAGVVEMRGVGAAETMLLRPWSLLMVPEWSQYGSLMKYPPFTYTPMAHEHLLGIGFFSSVMVIVSLICFRQRLDYRCILIVAIIGFVLFSWWEWPLSGGEDSTRIRLWRIVYHIIPGIASIAAIGRIALLLLIPVGMLFASFIDLWKGQGSEPDTKPKHWSMGIVLSLCSLLIGLCLVEQIGTPPHADFKPIKAQIDQISELIPDDASCFAIVTADDHSTEHRLQNIAILTAQHHGTPTLNFMSGNFPEYWPYYQDHFNRRSPNTQQLINELQAWAQEKKIPEGSLCIILYDSRTGQYSRYEPVPTSLRP